MRELSDEILVARAREGDEQAFAALVRRCERPLAAVIRREVRDLHHAEDVLQDALFDAWSGLSNLRDAARFGPWLMQIARNRCRDFHKSTQRRARPMESDELDILALAGRYGRGTVSEAADDALAALMLAPPRERDTARLFYLQGFTIAEIAERHECPEGTVRRRLFHAREHVRQTMGVEPRAARAARETIMSKHKAGSKKQPFPVERPKIEIVGSTVPTFEVDCREVPWWFAIPEVGNRTHWAIYDPPEWRVTTVTDMQVVRLAKVHELDGVEINVDEWKAETGWMLSERLMYARLTDSTVEWIGLASLDDGARTIFTHMDDGFEERWGGAMVRHMEDLGAFVAQEDGSFRLNEHEPGCIGAGAFTVTVGDNSFECLRVIDIYREVDEKGQLMEAYLSQDGRSVLVRRYNGLRWHVDDGKPTWDEKLPDNDRLVIDGTAYVHWYDCLTSTALGIDAA